MNSQFIEVGIGLVFVFVLMAVMVSALNEMVMSVFARRGRFMKKALGEALDDPLNKHWSQLLYDHPLIDKLKRSEKRPPAYISSATFALALIEVIANEGREDHFEVKGDETTYTDKTANLPAFERFRKGLATLKESHFKNVMLSFVNDSNGDYLKLKRNIENWFNEYMDRVGGWYKRKMKRSILVISFALTLVMNVDTIDLSIRLWDNAVLRETMVNAAEVYVSEHKDEYIPAAYSPADSSLMKNIREDTSADHNKILAALSSVEDANPEPGFDDRMDEIRKTYDEVGMLNLPIGWEAQKDSVKMAECENDRIIKEINANPSYSKSKRWWERTKQKTSFYWSIVGIYAESVSLIKILGWFFTAIAVSYGAPFWFDLLNKLINLRGNGKPTKKK